ncbi:MAG: hypothetical protein HKP14_02315 [Bacteroidia bacterium]|nr:hypothetical protein [Bacteroidia bacterium]
MSKFLPSNVINCGMASAKNNHNKQNSTGIRTMWSNVKCFMSSESINCFPLDDINRKAMRSRPGSTNSNILGGIVSVFK